MVADIRYVTDVVHEYICLENMLGWVIEYTGFRLLIEYK